MRSQYAPSAPEDRWWIGVAFRAAMESRLRAERSLERKLKGCSGSCSYCVRAGRQPASSASFSEQNQRSPRASSIVTLLYQGLHGM